MRRKIIIGNWKMNKTAREAAEFVTKVEQHLHSQADFGVAPSFLAIETAKKAAKNLIIAAQNLHFADSGAYTGEVSASMLQEHGIDYVIIGHSERRAYFGCTDADVNKQTLQALAHGITPIVCVGETEAQFDNNETASVIQHQVSSALAGVAVADIAKVVIAYEPIWAIGTGKSASSEIAQNACATVRQVVREQFGAEAAEQVRVQYGGSVNPSNIVQYLSEADIDGALIGGASLKAEHFIEIVKQVA